MNIEKPDNPHFRRLSSLDEAAVLVGFTPRQPSESLGLQPESISVFVMDHRLREVPASRRTVECHYGEFVVSQQCSGEEEARRQAYDVLYGPDPQLVWINEKEARAYDLGPVPQPTTWMADDIDGRQPAVVVWADGPIFLLVASDKRHVSDLVRVARSM